MSGERPFLLLQVDGTPGSPPRGVAGLGIVIRGPRGHVVAWRCAQAPAHSCNEAEYQAVIAGLRLVVERYPGARVSLLSDSRVVIDQLSGRCAVRASALQPLYAEAVALAGRIAEKRLRCIPRELNRLADALAWEALGGRQALSRYGT